MRRCDRIACALLVIFVGLLSSCGSSATLEKRDLKSTMRVGQRIMPVRGMMPRELTANFGAARDGGARSHEGLDIMAPQGREALAIVSGSILSIKWNALGGNTIWLQGDDGMVYYYAHLQRYQDGLSEGQKVYAGDVVGYVGQTGNATTPHLHFEIHNSRRDPAIDPYPVLRSEGVLVMPLPVSEDPSPAVTAPKSKTAKPKK